MDLGSKSTKICLYVLVGSIIILAGTFWTSIILEIGHRLTKSEWKSPKYFHNCLTFHLCERETCNKTVDGHVHYMFCQTMFPVAVFGRHETWPVPAEIGFKIVK